MPFHGWVTVDDGKIAAIGRGRHEAVDGQSVIEGGGAALIPGFVNTHAHSHSSLTRGSAEGLPLEKLAGGDRARAGAAYRRAGLCRCARDLCGGAAVWHNHYRRYVHPTEPALAAARDIGIRAVIVPYVADTKPFAPTLEHNARLLKGADDTEGRVRVWVGLHDLESCSDDSIRAGAALARAHGTGLHLHCSETRFSVERTRSRVGRTPVAHLLELGALDDRTLLAHCVWASEEDRALLASAGAHVAHCPHANLKLGSGIAAVPDMRRRGVNVSLATDGAKANNRLDMFDVMKFASLLHKGVTGDPTILPPRDIIDMATRGGAAALDLPVGAVVPGLKADLVLVRLDGFHVAAMRRRYGRHKSGSCRARLRCVDGHGRRPGRREGRPDERLPVGGSERPGAASRPEPARSRGPLGRNVWAEVTFAGTTTVRVSLRCHAAFPNVVQ